MPQNKLKPVVPFTLSLCLAAMDFMAISLACICSIISSYYVSLNLDMPTIDLAYFLNANRLSISAGLCFYIMLLFFNRGHYTNRIPWWTQVQYILKTMIIMFFIDGFISFLLELYYSRMLTAFNWFYCFFFILLGRYILYKIQGKFRIWKKPTVVIGDAAKVTEILFAFHADFSTGYSPHTVILRDKTNPQAFDPERLPKLYRNIRILDGNNNGDCGHFIEENPDEYYVVSLESFRGDMREDIIELLNKIDARYAIVPSVNRIGLYDREPRIFFGHDVMLLHTKKLSSPLGAIAKRALDIMLSSFALVVFSPILLLVMLMLKVEGQGGSLFYGGERVGKYGQKFKCWKFRSMPPDSDDLLKAYLDQNPAEKKQWEIYHKLTNDPRITTKTAKIIRKTSLDELPQLWNVLKGDMSIVGPRPILEHEQDEYGEQYKEYTKVKPGITGLWQVSGRNAVSFERRVYWDSWYVRNWSFWGDCVIILKTIPALLRREETA